LPWAIAFSHQVVKVIAMASDFFGEWRRADRAASAAEKSVFQDSMASIEGDSVPPPTPSALATALRLRALADDLYAVAMETFKAKAAKFKRY
jgi:hypothetical protein